MFHKDGYKLDVSLSMRRPNLSYGTKSHILYFALLPKKKGLLLNIKNFIHENNACTCPHLLGGHFNMTLKLSCPFNKSSSFSQIIFYA